MNRDLTYGQSGASAAIGQSGASAAIRGLAHVTANLIIAGVRFIRQPARGCRLKPAAKLRCCRRRQLQSGAKR